MKTGFISIKAVELLRKFGRAEWGKWKLKWKSPLWNFIITRNSAFSNAKREEFAEKLRLINKNCVVCNKKSFDNKLKM